MADLPRNSYAIEQRLRLIDFLLHQYGTVNRSALTNFFGISMPQAAHDFKTYREQAPGNMVYAPRDRCYVRTNCFERAWP